MKKNEQKARSKWFCLTSFEKDVTAVNEVSLAVIGSNEATESGKSGSEDDGELDHFDDEDCF